MKQAQEIDADTEYERENLANDTVVYQTLTHPRVAEFARKYRFPGWYIESSGCYGCMVGEYWISIFVNSCDGELDITVDSVTNDANLEWETPEDDNAMALTAQRFMRQYANMKNQK